MPSFRLADQDRDGVSAEIIYPTVGMMICNHDDSAFKKACFDAYNRWIADYCSEAPDRLLGAGQTALRTIEEGIGDLAAIKAAGLRGVMMPGEPGTLDDGGPDYDDPAWDPFWEAAVELGLPLSFHILTSRGSAFNGKPRGLAAQRVPRHHPGHPGHHGHARVRWGVRATPRPPGRVRRGRRRLGAALHVPDGPRLQPPPQLDGAGHRAVEAAVGVLRRAHLRHLPGRLDRVPPGERHELGASDVGERLPALATRRGRGRRRCSPSRSTQLTRQQQVAILSGNVADLYEIDVSRLPVHAAA